jgi:polar amino acid transport system substrate-binding protein
MRNRRIGIAVALTAVAASVLSACSSSGSSPSGGDKGTSGVSVHADAAARNLLPAAVKSSGKLTVATDASYPPFEFYASDNKTLEGADIDLAKAIGSELGITMDLQNASFDGIVTGIAAGKYDLAMSGMADRLDREKQVSFVDYAANGDAFLVLTPDKATYPTWASLCGLNVAVQSGTTMVSDVQAQSAKCTSSGKKGITASDYQTQNQGVLALTSGRSKVLISTGGSAAYIASQSNGQFASLTPSDNPPGTTGKLGIALGKDQTQLAKALQAAVSQLITDGSYQKIMTKWGLTQCCTVTQPSINGAVS